MPLQHDPIEPMVAAGQTCRTGHEAIRVMREAKPGDPVALQVTLVVDGAARSSPLPVHGYAVIQAMLQDRQAQ